MQEEIYSEAIIPIIESVLEGFNGTVLAYGQTSSGKTFTMQGPDIMDPMQQGIIPRMVKTVFEKIESASEDIEFTVKISMIEIYMEKIKDLLDPTKTNLKVHEDKVKGLYIADVTETYVGEELEVYQAMKTGNDNRAIGVTDMNKQSSRSHSIFIMTVSQRNNSDFSVKTGKLYLVDLAGSEKVGKTGAKGQTLDEAKTINKSLTALGLVINALTDGKSQHVPYRDSKLTRVLQESLGGNSKTCLIITCSPSIYNEAETISTLRFGKRAKQIKNKPKINKEVSFAEMKLMLEKAERGLEDKDKRIA
jgi:kinesin family member 5